MSGDSEPRFRRLDPSKRERQILASATRHFGLKPYSEVSIADIAADAGVVRGLVRHYFGNKRDLYLAVVRSMMFVPPAESMPAVEGGLAERISTAIDWLMNIIEANGYGWLGAATAGDLGADPEVQELLDEADDRAADYLLLLVGYHGEPGGLDSARAPIRAFGGMVRAMAREVVERRTISSQTAREILTAALSAAVETVLHDQLSGS